MLSPCHQFASKFRCISHVAEKETCALQLQQTHRYPSLSIPNCEAHLSLSVQDRTFEFYIKSPQTSYFLKKAAGISLGGGDAGHSSAGQVTIKHVYEIAKIKQQDPGSTYMSLESVSKSILGTARSMGIIVTRELE